jgi:SSS family solute:Na+ symporter
MTENFAPIDYIIFVIYGITIISLGLYLSRSKKGKDKSAQGYFLADRSLTWWAIGASLLAANISAEHFIAMSGSGFAIGLGIAAYEWIAAITLIIVAKYFLPIFIDKKIYTMPQFAEVRFNKGVGLFFAIFWLLVYVFVNLTSVSYLGALALEGIVGIPLIYGIIGLLLFSGIYSIYGGLSSVAWTDVIQVFFLVLGGIVTTFITLKVIGGGDIINGSVTIFEKARDHFDMIISKGQIEVPDGDGGMKDAFLDLPGLAVILGAMWLTNIGYWGFNQYIIQKGLAARSMDDAKKGLVFAGYLKLLVPVLVIIPGITAFVIVNDFSPEQISALVNKPLEAIGTIEKSDEAYPWLLRNFVPSGVRGLAFAALTAAIVSSLASMINSTSTIFTMDVYRNYIKKDPSDRQLVRVGRITALVALIIAMVFAPALQQFDQVFQYIQEYTGFIYPGAVVVFSMGLFWKQMTSKAAIWTAALTIPIGIAIKFAYPEMPFILRMGYVFIVLCLIASIVSFYDKKAKVVSEAHEQNWITRYVNASYLFLGLGVISLAIGVLFTQKYAYLGLESIFMMATLMLMLGIIIYTNVKIEIEDRKAIHAKTTLFETSLGFNLASIGIVAIVSTLYIFFSL